MNLDILIPHFERLASLENCLNSIVAQANSGTWQPRTILVLDDSQTELQPHIEKICEAVDLDLSENLPPDSLHEVKPIFFPYRGGKPRWAEKFNAGFKALPVAKEAVAIVSCDFILGPTFFDTATRALKTHESGVVLALGLNRPVDKALICGGPISAHADARLRKAEHGDNGMLWVLQARDWEPWDEDFDAIGFGHQAPEWLWRMHKKAPLWRCDRLDETHQEHGYEYMDESARLEQLKRSEILYRLKTDTA